MRNSPAICSDGIWPPFVRELCVSYYDRNYYKVREWTEEVIISLEDYGEAATALKGFLGSADLSIQRGV